MPKKLTLHVTPRKDGRVCKRIDGVLKIWTDEESARAELVNLIRRRQMGLEPAEEEPVPLDPPLRIIANRFIVDRNTRVVEGRLEARSCRDYHTAIDEFLASVGKQRAASELNPADFAVIREKWEKRLGAWKLDNRVQSIRTMFKWAHETARLLDRLPWYGDSFHKTTAALKRKGARDKRQEHGDRLFTPEEIKVILKSTRCVGPLRCFVLLGLNAGMYAAECAQLRLSDLRTEKRLRVIDTDRPKTGVRRKFILWPETADALAKVLKNRPTARNKHDADLLFITSHGHPWVRENVVRADGLVTKAGEVNSINMLLGRLLRAEGIKRPGVGFGAFRPTHVSAVADHPDLNAARMVRGHRIAGIEAHYDFPDLARLKTVTDLARTRLLLPATKVRKPRRSSQKTSHRPARA